jgi:hypothetical protein
MSSSRPTKLLVAICITLLAMVVLGTTTYIAGARKYAIADTARELDNTAHILARHTEQMLQTIVLVQDGISQEVRARGVTTTEAFDVQMSSFVIHRMLQDKMSALPLAEAVSIANAQGRLINSGVSWPAPDVNLSQRDYFKALASDPEKAWQISEPVRSVVSGVWTIFFLRKITAPDGRILGFVQGLLPLEQFQKFFASIALTPTARSHCSAATASCSSAIRTRKPLSGRT